MSLVSLGRPGRIDLRTRGGVGDGSTDNSTLFATLVAEASAHGAELYVPDGTYRGAMNAASNLRLTGPGTIKAKVGATAAPLTIPYAVTDVTVEGIGLDGAGLLGCLHVGVNGSSAVASQRIHIRGVRFANTKDATATSDSQRFAIYATQGFHSSSVVNCHFASTVNGGMYVSKPHHAVFQGNVCDGTLTRDFMYLFGPSGSSFDWGDGIVIAGNVAANIYRNAIEIQSQSTSDEFGPVTVSNNYISIVASGQTVDVFGVSVPNAPRSLITGNVIETDLLVSAGVEASSNGMVVAGNLIRGFNAGVTNTGSAGNRIRIERNTFLRGVYGVLLSNASGGNMRDCIIRGNSVIDPRDTGIVSEATSAWGGTVIEDNLIYRSNDAAWASDGSRTFTGIGAVVPDRQVMIRRNRVVQAEATPSLAGMEFIRLNSTTSWNRSIIRDNELVSLSTSPFGTGLRVTNVANVQDGRITGNLFKNLVNVVSTTDIKAVRFEQGGNRNEGCTNPETNLARAFYGLALPPSTHSTTPVMPSYLGATDNPDPASPPTGYHRVGDWYTNATPDSTEHWGIICTVAGSPGTFKSMGTIA